MNICISRQLFVTPVVCVSGVLPFLSSFLRIVLASFLQNHPASVSDSRVSSFYWLLWIFVGCCLLLGTLFAAAAVSSLK